jgi:protein SCO1/2
MSKQKKYPVTLITFSLIFIAGVLIAFFLSRSDELPIYNPADINPALVDESVRGIRNNHRIAEFTLVNQLGDTITEETFDGKIYVADFFFTRCGTICPKMTKQMDRAAEELADEKDVMFISHSVTPVMDSVPVLYEYAELYGANPRQWMLVTGEKKHIYDLARKFYFAVTTEGNGDETDFIHTENFVLIDKEKRIRGFYDGTSSEDVDRMIDDIRILLRSYETS